MREPREVALVVAPAVSSSFKLVSTSFLGHRFYMNYKEENDVFRPGPLFFWCFVIAIIVATITHNFTKSENHFLQQDSVLYAAGIISTFASYTAGLILIAATIGYSLGFKTLAKKSLVFACILSIGITLNFLA